ASGSNRVSREAIRNTLEVVYPGDRSTQRRKAGEIVNFVANIKEGDWVLPSDGDRVLAVGRVLGGYYFAAGQDMPHRRPVEWLSLRTWTQPEPEGLRATVYKMLKRPINRAEAERQRLMTLPTDPGLVSVKPPLNFEGIRG